MLKRITNIVLITAMITLSIFSTSYAWTDSNGRLGATWYSTWRDTTGDTAYWNVGTNIITSDNAGLVCCDFGYNPNTANDFVYSYCLDKYELHVSNMKQVNRGDYWFYARNASGDVYTTDRANAYEVYGTSLVKRYHLGGIVKYCVEWNSTYYNLTVDSFDF
jgi:hypothetical protein